MNEQQFRLNGIELCAESFAESMLWLKKKSREAVIWRV